MLPTTEFQFSISCLFISWVLSHGRPANPNIINILEKNSDYGILNNVLYFELKTEIPGAQTWRIDRTASAHAIELREPFLDYKLIEYTASVPDNLKINPQCFRFFVYSLTRSKVKQVLETSTFHPNHPDD